MRINKMCVKTDEFRKGISDTIMRSVWSFCPFANAKNTDDRYIITCLKNGTLNPTAFATVNCRKYVGILWYLTFLLNRSFQTQMGKAIHWNTRVSWLLRVYVDQPITISSLSHGYEWYMLSFIWRTMSFSFRWLLQMQSIRILVEAS